MADIKLTALPLAGTVANTDLIYLVKDPSTAPVSQKATVQQLLSLAAPPLPTSTLGQVLISQGGGVQPIFSPTVALGINAANGGGPIRLENNAYIVWRDGGNTGNVSGIKIDSTNNIISATNVYPDNAFLSLGSNTKRWQNVWVGTMVAIGANSASTGDIRLHAAGSIWARNAANTADIRLMRVNADTVTWGVPGNPIVISGQTIAFNVTPTAPTAAPGTSDTQLATTAFVTTAVAAPSAPTAHQATHQIGGTDVLLNNAWLDQPNVFTDTQTISKSVDAGLVLIDPSQPANLKRWKIYNSAQSLQFAAQTDAGATSSARIYFDLAGQIIGAYLDASYLNRGVVADARLSVNVLKHTGGYPGGTTTFLNAAGTFTTPVAVAGAHASTHSIGGSDPLVNAAWTNRTNQFTMYQRISNAGGDWPRLYFENVNGTVDNKKWVIQPISDVMTIAAVTDSEAAYSGGTFTINRPGDVTTGRNLTANGSIAAAGSVAPGTFIQMNGAGGNEIRWSAGGVAPPSYNSRSAGTKIVFYPQIGPSSTDYSMGMDSATLWTAVPSTADFHKWYGGTTLQMSLTGTSLTVSGNITANASLRSVGDLYNNTGSYRAAGDGLGLVMASNGSFQTFSDSWYWTNKANTAHRMLLDSANTLSVYGQLYAYNVVTGPITCTNINTQGYDVTTGTMTVTSAARIGNIRIQGDDATYQGYPWIRAAPAAHMVINGNPLYLNLDWAGPVLIYGAYVTINPALNCASTVSCAALTCHAINSHGITCHSVNTQGNNVTTGSLNVNGTSWTGHIYPLGGYNLGDQLYKWSGIALNLGPSASATHVVTDTTGWLFYASSERGTKKDIEPLTLDHAQAVLGRLTPFRYRDIRDESEGPKVVGFMVEDAMDSGNEELVTWYNDKPASVSYDRVGVYLALVVRDMQRQIDELKARLN